LYLRSSSNSAAAFPAVFMADFATALAVESARKAEVITRGRLAPVPRRTERMGRNMYSEFDNARISAISVVVPKDEISIYDEAEYYGGNTRRIDRMRKIVGFDKRRVSRDGTTAADLAACAAERLISSAGIDRKTIDAMVFVEQKLGYNGPMDAYELHRRLGLSEECACTSVLQGCAGWVWGVFLCSQMLQGGSLKRILLLNGDKPTFGIRKTDRTQAPLFGDAGCATLIERTSESRRSCFAIKTVSSGFDAIITPAGGCALPYDHSKAPDDPYNAPLLEEFANKGGYGTCLLGDQMDGDAVFEFTINNVPPHIKETLSKCGLAPCDIAKCCLHQANKQIVQSVGTAAGFELDDIPCDAFSKYGNNTMCSIPSVLAGVYEDAGGRFSDKPYLCSGFGNGLVVATAVLDLHDAKSFGVSDYEQAKDAMSRAELIDFWRKRFSKDA
jgi:3-oxoacyl-[acyl-carrier-protein] synthase-3